MAALHHRSLTNSQTGLLWGGPFPALWRPGVLRRAGATLRLWRRRIGDRHRLAELGERDLRDIGATRAEVQAEMATPFWRAAPPR